MIKFHVDLMGRRSVSEQVEDQVMWALRSGALAVGDRLPSCREAAHALGVRMGVVQRAYARLGRRGVLETRRGAGGGTFIARAEADESLTGTEPLRRSLSSWLEAARDAGLDDEAIRAICRDELGAFTAGNSP